MAPGKQKLSGDSGAEMLEENRVQKHTLLYGLDSESVTDFPNIFTIAF